MPILVEEIFIRRKKTISVEEILLNLTVHAGSVAFDLVTLKIIIC